MDDQFKPVGVVIQNLDAVSNRLPKSYFYEGIMTYSDTPLERINDIREAAALQQEFYDWIICQNEDGGYGMKPEAFYSPVFMRRYINLCQKCRMNLRFLFLEYDGDEALWKFDIPQGMVLGYEVCDTPRSFDLLHCLEREEYTEHREKLNYMGLFINHADALLYKESYEKEYYSGASPYYRDISPKLKLHVFRLTYIKSFPDYIPPSL